MVYKYQVAIDGPAGAGKSTVAKEVAKKLNFLYIDTGAIYRAVTYAALQRNIDLCDEQELTSLAGNIYVDMVFDEEKLYKVYADGKEVTEEIREPGVSKFVSQVARVPGVREKLLHKQKMMAQDGMVVMEGRDIGTAVIPEADFKFFLTATCEERARRRYEELKERNYDVTYESLLEEIKQRDYIDSTRSVAPLKPASDAIVIDCSHLGIEEVVNTIVSNVTGR